MRKFITLIMTISMLCLAVMAEAATVTGARWGQKSDNGLRFVLDLNGLTSYKAALDGRTMTVTVNADAAKGVAKSYAIGRKLADSMTIKSSGSSTILQVELKENVTKDEYKCFMLKMPYRIVLDVTPGVINDPKAVAPSKPANKQEPKPWIQIAKEGSSNTGSGQPAGDNSQPVVSNQPRKPANTGATWTPANSGSNNGSWTDRFHKDEQGSKENLTPSERVKQSIEAAKKNQPGPVKPAEAVTVKPQPSNQTGTAVTKPQPSTSTQQKVAETQSSLKKYLTAKQKARREAAANAASKKKVNKDGTTVRVEDGITYIKGNGKYEISGGLKDKVITIDAGHGGSDPGAIGASGLQEKNVTLPIAKALKEMLTKDGAKVYMTRTTDIDVAGAGASDRAELQGRVNVAEKYNSDAFISIHINSAANKNIGGLSTYYYPKTSNDKRLAAAILSKLTANFGLQDLGVREANFYVIKRSSMPATLLELGFISNPKEEVVLKSKWFQGKAAKMIYEGIKQYFK